MTQSPPFHVTRETLDERLQSLTRALEFRKTWVRRDELARMCVTSVRLVRDAASHSGGAILSGPKGLCLTIYASREEVEHSRLILLSQAREMIRRAMEIERVQQGQNTRDTRDEHTDTRDVTPELGAND